MRSPLTEAPQRSSWLFASDTPAPVGTYTDRFSPGGSLLAACILVASLVSVIWLSASIPKLDRIETPELALARMVGRTMDVQDGIRRAPFWKQQLLEWVSGNNEAERTQAIEWYRELARFSDEPIVSLELAILQAESGQVSQALLSAYEWSKREAPFPRYGEFIVSAYGEGLSLDRPSLLSMQTELAEQLPAGWFYERIAMQLAARAKETSLLENIERGATSRADKLLQRSWKLTTVELGTMGLGTLLVIYLWAIRRTHPAWLYLHTSGVPPPWPGGVGAAVLLRGGAIGAIMTAVLLLYMPPENTSLRALAIPLTNVPLLFLAYRYLFRPSGLSFDEGFGLDIPWSRLWRLALAVIAIVAAGLWIEWCMDRLATAWQLTSHWTEWFDADLVWGSPSQTLISLIEYVIFAPIFEELAFRGLLFAILRRKFQFLPAALISAFIFGVAHGYGVVGLLSVCCSGVLWAWIYEKTGSIVPGILAHAINNLLVCLAVIGLMR
ncbi:CPBP family intramembrane glutamic endopeptidase [Nitrospira sp. KM1]|uniref:CPBP family intramembrane glutamic endopeptidase n=1 Tax=Nitrospira sp. KM1 TaxID=1936990 RepID=UPI001564CE16|nr:CPBP family intramembrane glutamic endopeptidase [Nitrospira sp. KM1]